MQQQIHMPLGAIVKQWPYHVPEVCCQAIETEVAQMLQDGVIEESTSPWSSPIMEVPKPDRSLHLCNDLWKLNKVSEFNAYPMLWVDS